MYIGHGWHLRGSLWDNGNGCGQSLPLLGIKANFPSLFKDNLTLELSRTSSLEMMNGTEDRIKIEA